MNEKMDYRKILDALINILTNLGRYLLKIKYI
jgi:hypothetical protein